MCSQPGAKKVRLVRRAHIKQYQAAYSYLILKVSTGPKKSPLCRVIYIMYPHFDTCSYN